MCPSSTLHSSTHCSNDVSVDSVIGFSAGGSEANVTFERQRLHGDGGKGHDCRSRGTEASKEETDTTNDDRVQHCLQFRSGIQCDDHLGNSNSQRHFDTTITSVLPITRRWRLLVVSILQKERMRVRPENALMMDEDL